QTFFYGVPDSGIPPYHNLFGSIFNGPNWLTGGSVGPEASVFTPIVLGIVAILFTRVYRENRYQTADFRPWTSGVTLLFSHPWRLPEPFPNVRNSNAHRADSCRPRSRSRGLRSRDCVPHPRRRISLPRRFRGGAPA